MESIKSNCKFFELLTEQISLLEDLELALVFFRFQLVSKLAGKLQICLSKQSPYMYGNFRDRKF